MVRESKEKKWVTPTQKEKGYKKEEMNTEEKQEYLAKVKEEAGEMKTEAEKLAEIINVAKGTKMTAKDIFKPSFENPKSEEYTKRKNKLLKKIHDSDQSNEFSNHLDDFKNDKDIILAAVKKDCGALSHASEELRNDRDFVLAVVKTNGAALGYASEELKNDKDVVLATVKKCGKALVFASEALRNDKDVVLAAVKEDGDALQYASKELKNDKDVVLAAVKNDGDALQYASRKLQNEIKKITDRNI